MGILVKLLNDRPIGFSMVGSGSGKRRNSLRKRGMNSPLSGCSAGASVAISWQGDSRVRP